MEGTKPPFEAFIDYAKQFASTAFFHSLQSSQLRQSSTVSTSTSPFDTPYPSLSQRINHLAHETVWHAACHIHVRKDMEDNMHDKPIEPMSAENVEDFDVWIFDSQGLVVSVIPLHAPLNATTENYEISQQ